MSSSTRVQAAPEYQISLSDDDAFSLTNVIGKEGRKELQAVLDALPALRRKLAADDPQAAKIRDLVLDWKPIEDETPGNDRYRLTLDHRVLPARLRGATVILELELGRQVARVKRSVDYRSSTTTPSTKVRQVLQQTCNRAVNQLLALAAVESLSHKLAAFPQLAKATLENRVVCHREKVRQVETVTTRQRQTVFFQAQAQVTGAMEWRR